MRGHGGFSGELFHKRVWRPQSTTFLTVSMPALGLGISVCLTNLRSIKTQLRDNEYTLDASRVRLTTRSFLSYSERHRWVNGSLGKLG